MRAFRCFLMVPLLLTAFVGSAAVPSGNSSFQPNLGQLDPQAAFFAENGNAHLFVTRSGELVHRFPMADGAAWAVVERFDAAGELHPVSADAETTQLTFIGSQGGNRPNGRGASIWANPGAASVPTSSPPIPASKNASI